MIGAITLNPSIDQHITIKKLDDAIALFPFTGIPAERESMLPGPLSMAPGGLTDSLIQVFHRLSGAVLLSCRESAEVGPFHGYAECGFLLSQVGEGRAAPVLRRPCGLDRDDEGSPQPKARSATSGEEPCALGPSTA